MHRHRVPKAIHIVHIDAYFNTHRNLTFRQRRRIASPVGNETSTRKVIARLEREGWVREHGGRHDKFENSQRPELTLIVPRHRELSPGVARDIAKKAGWI
jgi:predicted RNA binding protein YcfA (HicA-like mRNA interferase family)